MALRRPQICTAEGLVMKVFRVLACVALTMLGAGALASAQQAPATPAAATPAGPTPAEEEAYVKMLLDNLDPCAGPLELQSKTSTTPCVYVAGEAAFNYGYTSANVPVTVSASGFNNFAASRSLFGHIVAYPSFEMQIGVGKHAQLSVIAPSVVQTNAGIGNGGATDLQLGYKQMVYKNITSGTLVSLEATYEAPTSAPPFGAAGPAYSVQAIVGQALPKHFGLVVGLPVSYGVVSTDASGKNQYGTQFAPLVVPYWQSPGGTMIALAASHSFNPNTTPIALSVLQLINRHVQIGATYGGVNLNSEVAGPVAQLVRFNTAAYPRVLSLTAYFLVGHSDIPKELIEIETAAAEAKAKEQQQK
jgi:hypothetical protein